MITRRSVRIKAMQYIYAYEISVQDAALKKTDAVKSREQTPALSSQKDYFENLLGKGILSVRDQYLYLLIYLRDISNFVEQDAKIKASKFIKKESDKNFNTKLLSNVIVQYLNNNDAFNEEIKKAKTESLVDNDAVRRLYKKFTESSEYKDYLNNGREFDVDEDRAILSFLLNTILLEDEVFMANTEEQFTNWLDDAEYVVEAVQEVIEKSKNELKLHFDKNTLKEKFTELTEFGLELYKKTIGHREEHEKMIEPKLKNWEAERLAVVDMILIRMAVSEFLYFPSIPIKVTINEYLDIAKEYSTPKSKDFINGVLDSLMKELKMNDRIQKSGRGLL